MTLITNPAVATALRCAGPAFYMGIQASSAQTALSIWKNKSVGDLSCIPFLSLFTNAMIGGMYGVLIGDKTIIIPNATGFVVGAACAASYYATQERKDNGWYLLSGLICLAAVKFFTMQQRNILGSMGCVLSIILLASPLATVKTVVKDKNTNALPFWTSVTTWINALSWSLFGLLMINDPWIYGPNMLGFVFATIQLALFMVYGLPKTQQLQQKSNKDMF